MSICGFRKDGQIAGPFSELIHRLHTAGVDLKGEIRGGGTFQPDTWGSFPQRVESVCLSTAGDQWYPELHELCEVILQSPFRLDLEPVARMRTIQTSEVQFPTPLFAYMCGIGYRGFAKPFVTLTCEDSDFSQFEDLAFVEEITGNPAAHSQGDRCPFITTGIFELFLRFLGLENLDSPYEIAFDHVDVDFDSDLPTGSSMIYRRHARDLFGDLVRTYAMQYYAAERNTLTPLATLAHLKYLRATPTKPLTERDDDQGWRRAESPLISLAALKDMESWTEGQWQQRLHEALKKVPHCTCAFPKSGGLILAVQMSQTLSPVYREILAQVRS